MAMDQSDCLILCKCIIKLVISGFHLGGGGGGGGGGGDIKGSFPQLPPPQDIH